MLKTCSVCGGIHDINKTCYRGKNRKKLKSNEFRDTHSWKEKRKQIKTRDKYLCQVCIRDKYSFTFKYNYKQLEVHHIIPIEEDYSKRLDSSNLITLCNLHHRMAEAGEITREELQEIVGEGF